jgi:hypothetical protein
MRYRIWNGDQPDQCMNCIRAQDENPSFVIRAMATYLQAGGQDLPLWHLSVPGRWTFAGDKQPQTRLPVKWITPSGRVLSQHMGKGVRNIATDDEAVLAAARQQRAEDLRALLATQCDVRILRAALAVMLSAAALTASVLCAWLRRRRIAPRL